MDRWSQYELFVQVAELGSISRAAEKLGLSNAAGSRHLIDLEARLGVRLVERTTRRLWLTEAGRAFLLRCTAALAEIREGEANVTESTNEPTGLLRVTSSLSFAIKHITPIIPDFRQRYPKLRVEVVAANRYPDFIEAGIDVAIRTRESEPDSGITVRTLSETPRLLAAAPGYLSRRGTPSIPEELGRHDMLIYTLSRDPHELHFTRGEERRDICVDSVLDANDGQILLAVARAGHGILIQPLYIIHDDLVAGRLVPILTDWQLPMLTINLAYQSRLHQPAKVRVFADEIIKRFERLNVRRPWSP